MSALLLICMRDSINGLRTLVVSYPNHDPVGTAATVGATVAVTAFILVP